MMAALLGRIGAVDILVNNAVVRHFSPVEHFPPERWDQALAVNLSAPFHLIRLALPGMKARQWGRIINMASIYSTRAVADRIDYVTTKTAIVGMTRAVAIETTKSGITCNALCPGTLPTPAIQGKIASIAASEGRSHRGDHQRLSGDPAADRAVRRVGGRRRHGGVPVQPGRAGHHRDDAADRRRMVDRMSSFDQPPHVQIAEMLILPVNRY